MLFSATFKKKVERLAREALTDAVRIVHGEVGEANEDVAQEVHIVRDQLAKFPWLMHRLVDFCACECARCSCRPPISPAGKVLIFVTRKDDADHLAQQLRTKDMQPLLLHGDMFQHDRNEVIQSFRKDAAHKILVATDVAGVFVSGVSVLRVQHAVWTSPKYALLLTMTPRVTLTHTCIGSAELAEQVSGACAHAHTHTRARAGTRGFAFTLLTDKDKEFAGHLVQCLEHAGQLVANNLIDLAMQVWELLHSFIITPINSLSGFHERVALS
jgi:ATP-dependent RNA helicase DDX42